MSQESLSPIARGRLCKTTEIFVRIEKVFFYLIFTLTHFVFGFLIFVYNFIIFYNIYNFCISFIYIYIYIYICICICICICKDDILQIKVMLKIVLSNIFWVWNFPPERSEEPLCNKLKF